MIYLDDRFPDHPKVVEAGDDAAWMYVAGLCYTNRNRTMGRIPKAGVSRLTGHRRPAAVAAKLVAVNLWEDRGDHYAIHDYEERNKTTIARSEHARKAAEARWGKATAGRSGDPPGDARASDEHVPEHDPEQCPDDAGAMRPSREEPKSPRAQESSSSSSSDSRPPADPPDDDDLAEAIEARVEAQLQERQSPAVVAKMGQVGDVAAWKAGARKRARAKVAEQGRSVLRPPPAKPADSIERTAAARREQAERNDAYARGEACGTCEGQGFVLDDDVVAVECPACRARPKAVGE